MKTLAISSVEVGEIPENYGTRIPLGIILFYTTLRRSRSFHIKCAITRMGSVVMAVNVADSDDV